jgi:hypothetical protein
VTRALVVGGLVLLSIAACGGETAAPENLTARAGHGVILVELVGRTDGTQNLPAAIAVDGERVSVAS